MLMILVHAALLLISGATLWLAVRVFRGVGTMFLSLDERLNSLTKRVDRLEEHDQ